MTERQAESKTFWRELWSAVDGGEPHDIWYAIDETKMAYLTRYLPRTGVALEVGCGTARLSRFLARRGFRSVGMDYEPSALRLAAERAAADRLEMTLLLGDAFALPFAAGSFDVVLSTGLLEHFADPAPIVAEMTRVLRPGGLFYSDIVPKKFSLMRAFESLTRRQRSWERCFDRRQIQVMLRQEGLQVKEVFAAGILPPLLPLVGRQRLLARIEDGLALALGRLTRPLDGTRIAELLGLYYVAFARKPFRRSRRNADDRRAIGQTRAA